MDTQKVVIFDFDGTIADIEPLVRDIYKELSSNRDLPPMTDKLYKELRSGTISEAIKKIGVRPWQLPGLLRQARALVYERRDQIVLFPGVADIIKSIHGSGRVIYILSANSTKTIHTVLEREGINGLVTVLKRPALFGKSKSVDKLIRANGYNKDNIWMVGDEVRDIEASHNAGVRCISVTWGLQDEIILKKYNPTAFAHKVKDIETILSTE